MNSRTQINSRIRLDMRCECVRFRVYVYMCVLLFMWSMLSRIVQKKSHSFAQSNLFLLDCDYLLSKIQSSAVELKLIFFCDLAVFHSILFGFSWNQHILIWDIRFLRSMPNEWSIIIALKKLFRFLFNNYNSAFLSII